MDSVGTDHVLVEGVESSEEVKIVDGDDVVEGT